MMLSYHNGILYQVGNSILFLKKNVVNDMILHGMFNVLSKILCVFSTISADCQAPFGI